MQYMVSRVWSSWSLLFLFIVLLTIQSSFFTSVFITMDKTDQGNVYNFSLFKDRDWEMSKIILAVILFKVCLILAI